MASAKWHGSTKLQLQPVIKIVERADSTTTVISYRGPWSECIAKKPTVGQTIKGFPGYIESVEPERERGQIGTLTISIRQGISEGGTIGVSDQSEVTWELHWEKIQKPLAAHPRYTKNNEGYGSSAFNGAKASDSWGNNPTTGECLVETVGEKMALIARMDTAEERELEYAKTNNSNNIALVRDYLAKLGKGTEGYNAYTPTLTKRTTSPKRPTATGAGFLLPMSATPGGSNTTPNSPLISSIPNADKYAWFKDGDDVVKTGHKATYERVEVWVAVDNADKDLYIVRNG